MALLFTAPALSLQSRSVNLALETSFLFDPQDIKENATFINKVQNVLDKLKTVLEPPSTVFRATNNGSQDPVVLNRFLAQIGSSLIKFDNNDFKKLTSDFRDAVFRHAIKNKEFHQLFEDERLRAFIKNTVTIWADTDPMVLKVEIAKNLIGVDTDATIKLITMLNKVFNATDEPKFKKLIKKFTKSIKHKDFTKFFTKTIDFVVFKRYKKLNFFVRQIVLDELQKFTVYVSKEYKDRIVVKDNDGRLASSEKIPEKTELSESNEKSDVVKIQKSKEYPIVIDKDLNLNVRTNAKDGSSLDVN